MGRFSFHQRIHHQKYFHRTFRSLSATSPPKNSLLWDVLHSTGGLVAKISLLWDAKVASLTKSHLCGTLCVTLAASQLKISLLWDALRPTFGFTPKTHTSMGCFAFHWLLRRQNHTHMGRFASRGKRKIKQKQYYLRNISRISEPQCITLK